MLKKHEGVCAREKEREKERERGMIHMTLDKPKGPATRR
jgi:hypothetical protein